MANSVLGLECRLRVYCRIRVTGMCLQEPVEFIKFFGNFGNLNVRCYGRKLDNEILNFISNVSKEIE